MPIQTARLEFQFTLKDGFRVIVTTPEGKATFAIPTNGVINWNETYESLIVQEPKA